MYNLSELELSNYGVYQDSTFAFMKGVTRVGGGNRSGKSLIFSPLPAIIYGVEDLVPKGGKAVLSGLVDQAEPFAATVFNHGKSDRFALSIDGVDQQTDTIGKSRAAIGKYFRVAQSVFNTTVTVSSKVPHPLATGTAASRLDWIHQTLAFSEVFDSLDKAVMQEIKNLREGAAKHKLLKDELIDLDKDAPPKPKKTGPTDGGSDLAPKLDELRSKLDALRAQERLPLKPKLSSAEYTAKIKALRGKIKEAAAQHDKYAIYRARMDLYEQAIAKRQSAQTKLEVLIAAVGAPTDMSNEALLKACRKQITKLERQIEEARDNNHTFESQRAVQKFKDKKTLLPDTKGLPKEVKDLEQNPSTPDDLDAVIRKLNKLMNYYESLSEDMTGECKICGKNLDENAEAYVAKAQKIKNYANTIEFNFNVKLARKVEWVEHIDVPALEAKIESRIALANALEKLSDAPDRPKKVEFDEAAYEAMKERLSDLKTQHTQAVAYEEATQGDVKILPVAVREDQIAKLERQIRKLNSQMIELNDERIQHATAVSLWKRYTKQREDLLAKIVEVKSYPRQLKVALALRQAFGRDGLRVNRLNETLELYVANLNACAPLLFNEPFKFEIEVGARKCDVIAHRNNSKGSIFTLSGSESRGWQAIAALAMLRILPSAHRFDTIILDEVEANTDPASRDRYANAFIPEVSKAVDNVIVVTPLPRAEMHFHAEHEFEVRKRNGVSTIKRRR